VPEQPPPTDRQQLCEARTDSAKTPWDLIVVGAGAAGLLAATRAAQLGQRVLLVEKNRKPGVKILMSGGTRCNLTHATDRRGIVEAFGKQGRFLHSALAALGPEELVELFEGAGVATKVEETGKVFPVSNRALDVQRALLSMLRESGGELALGEPVSQLTRGSTHFEIVTSARTLVAPRVLLTTGGQSYPGCGTTGDGYAWARELGHRIVPPRPALVPLTSDAAWVRELQGVTLPDISLQVAPAGEKVRLQRRGSLLFTHFGLSGPAAMDVSRAVTENPSAGNWQATVDFLPDVDEQQLVEQLLADGRRTVGNALAEWLPRRVAIALTGVAGVPGDRRAAELPKAHRRQMVTAVKRQAIGIRGTLGFKKAEVTAGGVDLRDVDSRTLESKTVPGLYFAGEILDLDGPIGGYNFQAAFSTGWLAAEAMSR
jgi:predicted Rossmann fold flavoprotein